MQTSSKFGQLKLVMEYKPWDLSQSETEDGVVGYGG